MARSDEADRWLSFRMAEELLSRAEPGVTQRLRILQIGWIAPELLALFERAGHTIFLVESGLKLARQGGGIQADEDFLPIRDSAFDLVLATGTLDRVNDLPGALILARRALRPGGRFLGALMGADSLELLRQILLITDNGSQSVMRLHPQIDVRAAGDLLARAGFSQPVADTEAIKARYPSIDRLLADLRANGLSNALMKRFPLSRQTLSDWRIAFDQLADETGRATETFCPVYLSGIAPNATEWQKFISDA